MIEGFDPKNREQHERWEELLQEAIDGTLSGTHRESLDRHVSLCPECRTQLEQLTRVDRSLRINLAPASPSADFDQRVRMRVASLEHERLANARLREVRAHQARLREFDRSWRGFWRFNLGNVIGMVALALSALAALTGKLSVDGESWFRLLADFRIPIFLFVAGCVAALTISITRLADRDTKAG